MIESNVSGEDGLPDTLAAMEAHAQQAADLLGALSNVHRLLILCVLAGGEKSVGELNKQVPLSQSALSQHLGVLRKMGVVSTRRVAQTIFYAVVPGPATDIVTLLHAHFCGRVAEKQNPVL